MVLKPGFMRVALLLTVASLVVVPACTPLGGAVGGVGEVDRRSADLIGEVRAVDTRSGRIQLREAYGGTRSVRYDRRTRVFDGEHRYAVSALRRGDRVRVRIVYDRRGAVWADRVEVRRGVRHGREAAWRVERLAGTVRRVELRRDYFTLEPSRSRAVVVRIPGHLRGDDARRLRRLRHGDRVRVEVRPLGRNAVELIRFR